MINAKKELLQSLPILNKSFQNIISADIEILGVGKFILNPDHGYKELDDFLDFINVKYNDECIDEFVIQGEIVVKSTEGILSRFYRVKDRKLEYWEYDNIVRL